MVLENQTRDRTDQTGGSGPLVLVGRLCCFKDKMFVKKGLVLVLVSVLVLVLDSVLVLVLVSVLVF